MNSKDIRGLPVISITDGTQVGTIDQVYLDLIAKQVVGFSITNGVGPFGGVRNSAPTVAASGVHSLGPDALTIDDIAAAHAGWVGATYGPVETLDALTGRKVVTEGGANAGDVTSVEFDAQTFSITEVEVSPGFLKTNTHVSLDRLVRIGPDVLVIADVVSGLDGWETDGGAAYAMIAPPPAPGNSAVRWNGREAVARVDE